MVGALILCSALAYDDDKCKTKNCKECDYKGQCKRCEEGYWVWNGECIDCIYGIDWCEDCSSDGRHCFKCQKGFFLNKKGLCEECKTGINMCEFCSEDGKECFECIKPWELKDGKCFYNPYGSSSWDYKDDDKKEDDKDDEKEEEDKDEEKKDWGWDSSSGSNWGGWN